MSKTVALPTAAKAIEQAKKNSLKRKDRVAKEFREICAERIQEMIKQGIVFIQIPMTEEHKLWGLPLVQAELEAAGYKVEFEEDEKNEDVPDMYVSIEHLK